MANVMKNLLKLSQDAARNAGHRPPTPPRGLGTLGGVLVGGTLITAGLYSSLFTVEGGHRAVMFNRVSGVSKEIYQEGMHFRIPWFEKPTIFNIRTRPTIFRSPTGTKDLQTIDITLRVLFRPDVAQLPAILQKYGTNFDERVLPSIVNETLKSVIAQFNANQLITQREEVSRLIRRNLTERASEFHIVIEDTSITHLSFGNEYMKAIEDKQVAQQDAERAKYQVKQALEDKKSTIIKAMGEAKSAEMIGEAVRTEPGYLELRRLEAAKEIAHTMAKSPNRIYLDADTLLLNVLRPAGNAPEKS